MREVEQGVVRIADGAGVGPELVLGGDLGGTSTRVVVADRTGRVVGRGAGPGGNPVAHPGTAHAAFADALAGALAGVDPAAVRAGVVGMAGCGSLRDPSVRGGYEDAWAAAGLAGVPHFCSDLEVAYAAGTDAPDGTVLIAGTGAVAGLVRAGRLVATAGGHGWLLGDEGAGFWLGREAVRAALRALDGRGRPGPLAAAVLRETGVGVGGAEAEVPQEPREAREARVALIGWAHARPPVALSALAPLVTRAHHEGDAGATAILAEAAGHLVRTWEALDASGDDGPLVLAGAVLAPDGPVGERVRRTLAARAVPTREAGEPVDGAVRLALRRLDRI